MNSVRRPLHWIACFWLSLPILPASAVAQEPVGEEVVGIISEPVTGSAEAFEALRTFDHARAMSDRDYAEEILAHLDLLEPAFTNNIGAPSHFYGIRLLTLGTLGRDDEVRAIINDVLERRPSEASGYTMPWAAAMRLEDSVLAVHVIERASTALRANEWPALRNVLQPHLVWPLFRTLRDRDEEDARTRLAEALFRIGWPGLNQPEDSDWLRVVLLEDRLRRGDRVAASHLAAAISTPEQILPLVLLRRYDNALAPDVDRLAMIQRAIAQYDRETAAALAAAPQDMDRIFDRAQFLRERGLNAEALTVLEPFIRDVPTTVAAHRRGMWIVNEAVYALLALDRTEEAVSLGRRLADLPIAGNQELVGPSINYSMILWRAGRYELALEHALRLERETGQHTSEAGKMWIYASIVCALQRLNRVDETSAWMERLRSVGNGNPAALMRAHLCLDDMAAAEAVLIDRLQGDDLETAIYAVQDYTAEDGRPLDVIDQRLRTLRDRPAVHATLDRVGHLLMLPLSRDYWGGA